MSIEAWDFRVGQASSAETVYFAGGVCAFQTPDGWAVGPALVDSGLRALQVGNGAALTEFVRSAGLFYVGTNIPHRSDASLARVEFWELGRRDPVNGMQAADSWSAIAYQAEKLGDQAYADSANYLAVSMQMASLRLRDVARHYREQLEWAVQDGKAQGKRFSNVAMLDLYADFHSLVSELASARDHLARIAAIEGGAPEKIDSLARLQDWAGRPIKSAAAATPMISLLLSQLLDEPSSWLVRFGKIRNEMIHRIPMAASKSSAFFRLDQLATTAGPLALLRLVPSPMEVEDLSGTEPLVELTQIANAFEQLAREAWKMAKFPADLPSIVVI
ncbi:hypothetical protein [Luteimonas fraxinea]|uniref:hypothetical protein n=1 Tax=Luteimonas fraxinea TaxID=2901869 RepID=UPI001E427B62|nr:hypothetical protein [Luteimonas fraxinea]MCD9126691.1 hypothetical protein [Luteimonas fraxinea]